MLASTCLYSLYAWLLISTVLGAWLSGRRAVRLPSDGRGVVWLRLGATRSDLRDHLLRDGVASRLRPRSSSGRGVDTARGRCADESANPRRPVRATAYTARAGVARRIRNSLSPRPQQHRASRYFIHALISFSSSSTVTET